MKRCTQCKLEQPLASFGKNRPSKDGLNCYCKACVRLQNQAFYAKNREREMARVAASRTSPEIRERDRLAHQRWLDENAEQQRAWRQSNKDLMVATGLRWRRNNPGDARAVYARRRAAKKRAQPAWANDFFIREAYALAALRERVCGGRWEVDHIVPLQSKLVCGLHVEHNLQVITMAANRMKANRLQIQ